MKNKKNKHKYETDDADVEITSKTLEIIKGSRENFEQINIRLSSIDCLIREKEENSTLFIFSMISFGLTFLSIFLINTIPILFGIFLIIGIILLISYFNSKQDVITIKSNTHTEQILFEKKLYLDLLDEIGK